MESRAKAGIGQSFTTFTFACTVIAKGAQ